MKNHFFSNILLLVSLLSLMACQEKTPDLQAINTFFPASKMLKKGIVNKYYYHSKEHKSYDIRTDIEYVAYQSKKDGTFVNNHYNPGFDLTLARNLQFEKEQIKLLSETYYSRTDSFISEIIQPAFLSLLENSIVNEKKRKYPQGEVSFKEHILNVEDTIVFNQPAKIIEGERFFTSDFGEKMLIDSLPFKLVFVKNLGLFSAYFENKNGTYWRELVEQIPFAKYKELANHGRHRIAYIDPANTMDDNPNFKICNQNIADYYNHDIGHFPILKGGKSKLFKILEEKLKPNLLFLESGYLTFRFVVNCEGEAGRFVTEETDLNYQPKQFNPETVAHLYEIVKNIKDWRTTMIRRESRDAYAYITFKLSDGEIIELLP